ncbi:unnamed protein product [Polarella glacialis]|uniref:SPRY domain-containing protein n=1 Tax=Polarella glacialis TaxID=89957 RepID=A0A813M0Q9_POLGL|nr:unnamed protein product [Polarella glacialis]
MAQILPPVDSSAVPRLQSIAQVGAAEIQGAAGVAEINNNKNDNNNNNNNNNDNNNNGFHAGAHYTADSVASVFAFLSATSTSRVNGGELSLACACLSLSCVRSQICAYLLQTHGRFSAILPQGGRIQLEGSGDCMRKTLGRNQRGWSGRLESTACGAEAVSRGRAAWTVVCSGEKFIIGVVPDGQWSAFSEECPTFVPFVCAAGGFGVGLLNWDGLFLCQKDEADKRLRARTVIDLPLQGTLLTVLLDMEQRLVQFFVDGKLIPGAEATVPDNLASYRFAASVYGVDVQLSFRTPELLQHIIPVFWSLQ